jgi:hypothetical protein
MAKHTVHPCIVSLPATAKELGYDVTLFNEHVTEQINDLAARGIKPEALEYLLYAAYITFNDDDFVTYIKGKRSEIFDNTIQPIEFNQLMYLAHKRFKLLMTTNDWTGQAATGIPTVPTTAASAAAQGPTDEHIVSLIAQALSANTKASGKKSGTLATTNSGEWKWKDHGPKTGESHFKTFKGNEYVHCPNHKGTKWVLVEKHKDGCTLNESWKFPTKGQSAASGNGQDMQYHQALMGVMADNDVEDWTDDVMFDENI